MGKLPTTRWSLIVAAAEPSAGRRAAQLVERQEPRLPDREPRQLELAQRAARVLLDQPRPRRLCDLARPFGCEPE